MKKIKLEVLLIYDDKIWYDDEESYNWFLKEVLKGKLHLISLDLGDAIGNVKVLEVKNGRSKRN